MSLMATAWQMRKRMVIPFYHLIPVERTIGTFPCAKAYTKIRKKNASLGLAEASTLKKLQASTVEAVDAGPPLRLGHHQ